MTSFLNLDQFTFVTGTNNMITFLPQTGHHIIHDGKVELNYPIKHFYRHLM